MEKRKELLKDKKLLGAIGGGIALIIIGTMVFRSCSDRMHPIEEQTTVAHYNRGGPCPGDTKYFEMEDDSMPGTLNRGEKFKVILNYYSCNDIKKGDLVYYQYSPDRNPIVRIAVAVPGDKFVSVKDKQRGNWNLSVNGSTVKITGKNDAYYFGSDQPPTLTLYEKPRNNVLKSNEIILFAGAAPGIYDSGTLGVLNLADVVGKVEVVGGKAESQGVTAESESSGTPAGASGAAKKVSPTAAPVKTDSKPPVKHPAKHPVKKK